MALITRVSRLFQADFHAVLDRIEEPDLLLKQAVREMQEEISREEQRLKLLKHEYSQINVSQSECEQSLVEIEEELDVCFGSGEMDLARIIIRRKIESQRAGKALSLRHDNMKQQTSLLENQLQDYRQRLKSMSQKLECLIDESADDIMDRQQPEAWRTSGTTVLDEDVEVAYLRELKKRTLS